MVQAKVFKQIDPNDINVTPFKVYKEWEVSDADYSSSYGLNVYRAIYPDNVDYPGGVIPIGTADVARTEPTNSVAGYQKIIYDSIKQLFYSDNIELYYSTNINRSIYATASIASIPQQKFGEKLNPGSISIQDNSVTSSYTMTLQDDSFGNIYDTVIVTSSFAPAANTIGYWGFNEKYDLINNTRVTNGKVSEGSTIRSKTVVNNNKHGIFSNVVFEHGIQTTGLDVEYSGVKATFDGTGWISVENRDDFNFFNKNNFAISCWINLPVSQSILTYDYNGIISKQGEAEKLLLNRETKKYYYKEVDLKLNRCPFFIRVYNQNTTKSGKIYAGKHDGLTESWVTSSAALTGSQHHIVFQKNGSALQLYVDGALDCSSTDNVQTNTINDCKPIFGSIAKTRGNLSGSIDEIRIFNTYLTQAQISSLADNNFLSGSAYQTRRVGNVFYEQGIIVISDPRPKYRNVFLGEYIDDIGFDYVLDFRLS